MLLEEDSRQTKFLLRSKWTLAKTQSSSKRSDTMKGKAWACDSATSSCQTRNSKSLIEMIKSFKNFLGLRDDMEYTLYQLFAPFIMHHLKAVGKDFEITRKFRSNIFAHISFYFRGSLDTMQIGMNSNKNTFERWWEILDCRRGVLCSTGFSRSHQSPQTILFQFNKRSWSLISDIWEASEDKRKPFYFLKSSVWIGRSALMFDYFPNKSTKLKRSYGSIFVYYPDTCWQTV